VTFISLYAADDRLIDLDVVEGAIWSHRVDLAPIRLFDDHDSLLVGCWFQSGADYRKNVSVLDSGARGATTTFVERGIGDVLLAWENEAFLAQKQLGPGKFEIVVPSVSVLAEPAVAVVDTVALRRGTRSLAQAYLEFLYTPQGQEIVARHYYRPRDAAVLEKYRAQFAQVELVDIGHFGGWKVAQKQHFASGGVFDQITTVRAGEKN
jgi:sulfate transport system substrate-binding protein